MTPMTYSLKMTSEEKINYPNLFTYLEKIAIVQSVKSSNAIERIVSTDKRFLTLSSEKASKKQSIEQIVLSSFIQISKKFKNCYLIFRFL